LGIIAEIIRLFIVDSYAGNVLETNLLIELVLLPHVEKLIDLILSHICDNTFFWNLEE
jgi:hypothetical protein